jgi:hypothetical protein
MMIESKKFKGIEYVQLSELPQAQQQRIIETLNNDLFIKIMIDGKIIDNCVQYKDYSFWYTSVYKPQSVQPQEKPTPSEVEFQPKLVFK